MLVHERYMQRAIELAQQGLGHTRANPVVGCVIVHNNKIIGEGFHFKYGGDHAEIVAIKEVKNTRLLAQSTMYVTLEPCSHYGKTPPCSQRIIDEKIPHVVVASKDPNPLVSGNGIKMLQQAGIIVQTGILENEYRFVNRRFFTFHEKKRPYIILKWAQSSDGYLSPQKNYNDSRTYWISNQISKMLVHKWRSEEMAILVGANTVINDNPQLTVRLWKGENPLRIVIQNKDFINLSSNVFNFPPQTIRFTTNSSLSSISNVETFVLEKNNFLEQMLNILYNNNIVSLIVEGGAYTLNQFLLNNLWDEARIITGKIRFNKGLQAPTIFKQNKIDYKIGNDVLTIIYNT